MKKVLAIGLVVLMLVVPVLATDLDDFKTEQVQLQQRLVEYQQTITNIQVRLVELNALINYCEEIERRRLEEIAIDLEQGKPKKKK